MKSLEQLAQTTTSDIDDFKTQIIRDAVLKTARELTVGRDLVNIVQMRKGADEYVFAISDKLTASSYSEGGTVSTQKLSLTAVTLGLDEHYSVGVARAF